MRTRIVIVGAGISGLAAAHKIYTNPIARETMELCVVEGGDRIGGRINTAEFCGGRIEMGATWIHGIEGNPIHKIAQDIEALQSEQPWEWMHGYMESPKTMAEGGFEVDPSFVASVSSFFESLKDYAKGKPNGSWPGIKVPNDAASIGCYLRRGLEAYRECMQGREEREWFEGWTKYSLEEALLRITENIQRVYTSAGDLMELDYKAEKEYVMFPGEEITIAKGYQSIVKHLSSVLPRGVVQLGKKVDCIEWLRNGNSDSPVILRFSDGTETWADHVIVTVSLGVLKGESGLFVPPLPESKKEAISKLGYGLVNKVFLEMDQKDFPFLQLAFHEPNSENRRKEVPWWIRKTALLYPIYENSSVVLTWFAGEEAKAIESLTDDEIIAGVSETLTCFGSDQGRPDGRSGSGKVKLKQVLRTKWGSDPLFMGSYCYIATGSSGNDIDTLAEPLPAVAGEGSRPLQILFGGEATHRTHYSTTHGAYISGIREASRLLDYYHCV